jgi:hypothetical protein
MGLRGTGDGCHKDAHKGEGAGDGVYQSGIYANPEQGGAQLRGLIYELTKAIHKPGA